MEHAVAARLQNIENGLTQHTSRMDHLDKCVDELKVKVDAREKLWDERWSKLRLLAAFVAGLVFASGSGIVSLSSILKWIGVIH